VAGALASHIFVEFCHSPVEMQPLWERGRLGHRVRRPAEPSWGGVASSGEARIMEEQSRLDRVSPHRGAQSAIRNPQSAIESRLDRVSPYRF